MLHCLSGLPRSGSTLLCNILAQHPDLTVTATSPLVSIVETLRDNWRAWHRAVPEQGSDDRLFSTLKGALDSYHPTTTLDKNRSWLTNVETLDALSEDKVKFVLTTRDLADVVASFEMVWRRNLAAGRVPSQLRKDPAMSTTRGRAKRWLSSGDVIGSPLSIMSDVVERVGTERFCLVDYEDLTTNPKESLEKVRDYLGLPEFDWDFDNVSQLTTEDDEAHGYADLHTIRPVVKPQDSRAKEILGEDLARQLSTHDVWWKK